MKSQYVWINGQDDTTVKKYYEDLKVSLNFTLENLKKTVNFLNEFKGDLVSYYTVDNSEVDSVNIEAIKEELNSKIRDLENTIIPAINNQINSIKNTADKVEKIISDNGSSSIDSDISKSTSQYGHTGVESNARTRKIEALLDSRYDKLF